MIKPVFTEKSTKLAKEGKYTFLVDRGLGKGQIKAEIAKLFGIHVIGIKTVVVKGETGKNMRGAKFTNKGSKKAVVTLKEKEKIDLFEEAKK